MDSPKISVIIPAYNEEHDLPHCVRSAIASAEACGETFELIVIDNASTDRTADVARSLGANVVSEPQKGVTRARQAGFEAARGELVAYFDADCVVPKDWFQRALTTLRSNPTVAAVSGRNVFIGMHPFYRAMTNIAYRCGIRSTIQGSNFLVKRSALEQIGGFDTGIEFYGEDADLSRRLTPVGGAVCDFHMVMHTSNRRFEQKGLLTTALRYLINLVWINVLHRPLHSSYDDVRNNTSTGSKRRSTWIPRFG